MKKQEAQQYLDKKIRIILKNNFRFSGLVLVLEVGEDTLRLQDRFDGIISVSLEDIMLVTGVRE